MQSRLGIESTAIGVLMSAALLFTAGAVTAAPGCLPMRGSIVNNAVGSGTLGVARFKLGDEAFLCAIQGIGKPFDPDDDDIGPLNFDHTIVCEDDDGRSPPLNSQLLWDTSGFPTVQHEDCGGGFRSFSFFERSRPVVGSGRFGDVIDGELVITGTIYCTGALKMQLLGVLCSDSTEQQ